MLTEQEQKLFKVAGQTLTTLATAHKELQTKYAELEKQRQVEKVAEKFIANGKAEPDAKEELMNKIANEDIGMWDKIADLEVGDIGMHVSSFVNKEAEATDPLTKAILGI